MNKPVTNLKLTVTIGVCVRNSASTIGDAVNSILQQDFPHDQMEILVVDGYSTDNTISAFRIAQNSSEIKQKIFCASGGIGRARQIVVDKASGKYIVWVDGDMTLSKDFVRKQVEFMEQNPNVGIAKGKLSLQFTSNLLGTLETFSRAASKMVNYQTKSSHNKVLGTSGCIYRTQAIKQAGGFDESVRGYGEDWDAEIRVRALGWSMATINVTYLDYERNGMTWKILWIKYWRRGYDTHYFLHKRNGLLKHYRMFPLAAIVSGFLHAKKLYRMTRKKLVFLLPLQYYFKMTAWYVAFIRSHFDSYQPK